MKWLIALMGALLFILVVLAYNTPALPQERLFGDEGPNIVIMEAYVALEPPSDEAFGRGLILRYYGKTALHAARSWPIRNEICPEGTILGCHEWVDDVCVLHYDVELHDERYAVVLAALLPRLYADCGLTQ